jgi:hypothetical protein
MNCVETQRAFSPYLDGDLTREECAALDSHLDVCLVCRVQMEQTRELVRALALVERPAPPPRLAAAISHALAAERAERAARPAPTVSGRLAHRLQPHLMPYAVGAFYSLLLFVAVIGALKHQLTTLRDLAVAQRKESPERVTWLGGRGAGYDVTQPLSPSLYAAARSPYTSESPSLNPRGALARMTWTPPPAGRPDDDDMIVVADVYGNGRASLAAVVEPPRNPRALDDLQDALRKNPAFVPASIDGRPQSLRVVFVLQKMNVDEFTF